MRALLALVLLFGACSHASSASSHALSFDSHGFHVTIPSELATAAAKGGLDVGKDVDRALARIQPRLQTKPTSIEFFVGPQVIPQYGTTGFTRPDSGVVTVTVDVHSPVGLRTILGKNLGPVLAHELHHSKRILEGPGYGARLGDAVVTEGMAIVFEREVYADDPPFARALTPAQEFATWKKLQPHLGDLENFPTHGRWFFGTGDVPMWTGYTIGYHIAASYLRSHSHQTAANLALVPAQTILSQSSYNGHVTPAP